MKKILSLIFVFVLALTIVGCGKKDQDSTLIVGTTTEPGVNFFGTFWGNNATNNDVRRLTMGYGTVSYQKEAAKYEVDNTVVKNFEVAENEDHSKTYTLEINKGLVWNDEKPVTAKDYVFALLLSINPVLKEASPKANVTTDGTVVGSKDYNDAEKNTDGKAELTGVSLLGDYKFSITVGADHFPYYYEFLYYSVTPYPLHHLAPEADVEQGTKGAKITGKFDADVLKSTIDDGSKGYRYDIKVTCGAYDLYNYDADSSTITLKKNRLYKGNYEKQQAQISNIVIKYVQSNVLLQSLLNGEINLITSLSGGDTILAGLGHAAYGKINFINFSRNGYGLIGFHCDEPVGPTSHVEVRQAIAYLLNRDLFVQTYTKGYGVLPNGEYGLAQWMVQASTNENDVVVGKNNAGELVPLNSYSYDPVKAAELLAQAGYKYNEDGTDYVQAEDNSSVRYRKLQDGTMEKLEVAWANTTGNPVSDLIRAQLIPNAKAVGMAIKDQAMDFNTLLYTHYYGMNGDGYSVPEQDENGKWVIPEYEKKDENSEVIEPDMREYHMVNLATGFNTGLFEPYYDVSIEYWGWDGGANINYLYDEEMLDAAWKMMRAANDEEYLDAWQRYQYRFNYLLPSLPLYSDLYHSFFSKSLQDYDVTAEWVWTDAVLYANMVEVKK